MIFFAVLLAVTYWLENKQVLFIWFSAISAIIFRAELCLLVGPLLFVSLVRGKVNFFTVVKHSIAAGFSSVGKKFSCYLLLRFFFERHILFSHLQPSKHVLKNAPHKNVTNVSWTSLGPLLKYRFCVFSLSNALELQLHDAIYRLRFCSNSLIHVLSLSNSDNNVRGPLSNIRSSYWGHIEIIMV